jgi:glycosyltransferase involved in cell wall biosynthesis
MSADTKQQTTHHLNIICFDVPFPADYGGAMEEFYKLKALHQLGIKIHLHCFEYGGRKPQPELAQYCESVVYYKRERKLTALFSSTPFIVKTRMHPDLLENLLNNDYPILFDGTHSTGFVNHPVLKDRKRIVRFHNIEWIYYSTLFHAAVKPTEKLFYFTEYKKLRRYDAVLSEADYFSCLSVTDYEYYAAKYAASKVSLEFVFHENETIRCKPGKGNYLLYHGNLAVLDNYSTVMELLSGDLKDCSYQIIIAGKNPDPALAAYMDKKPNMQLIPNPTAEELDELIQNAQICLALAQNPSGIKLKLINSLFQGRWVFSNEHAFAGSGLDDAVIDVTDGITAALLDKYMQAEFTEADMGKREKLLTEKYSNLYNAKQLVKRIFG